jgi:hypothetical protein
MRSARAAALAAAAVVAALAAAPARAEQAFSPAGPWNKPIAANPALEPTSAAQVNALATYIRLKADPLHPEHSFPYFQHANYSTPIHRVGAGAPKRSLTINGNRPHQQTLIQSINGNGGVPFPPGAQAADGTDGHITVLDTSAHVLYEFWRASSPEQNAPGCTQALDWGAPCHGDGQWHAEYGGIMDQYDTDPGYFSNAAWPGLAPTDGWHWGATATSLPLLGGLITFEDLRSGVIGHAVGIALPDACASYFVHPAQRSDGNQNEPTCIPEGARLQLDPTYDVNADTNPPLTKAVERAAQKYGLVVHDITHDNVGFAGQDPQTEATNPYRTGPGVGGIDNGNRGFFGDRQPYNLFQSFPWSRLRVIAARHCTAHPCLP